MDHPAQNHQQQRMQPGLLQLPPEPLLRIWEQLGSYDRGHYQQHNLRCTCRSIRDITAAWIRGLLVITLPTYVEAPRDATPRAATLHSTSAQMAQFPKAAQLRVFEWYCEDHSPTSRDAPDILPEFLFTHRERFELVTKFTLHSSAVVTYGDFAAIAAACPALQELSITQATIHSPAFAPLAHLTSLRSLELQKVETQRDQTALIASLRQLSQLTSLVVGRFLWEAMDYTRPPACQLLQWVQDLIDLRSLKLHLTVNESSPVDVTQYVSTLQHLTCLHLQNCTLSVGRLPQLASASRLVSLHMESQSLCTTTIRALASLPNLRGVAAKSSTPNIDLSHLRCSWTQLMLTDCRLSLTDMAWLPIQGLQKLVICAGPVFTLPVGSEVDALLSLVHKVASTMAGIPVLEGGDTGFDIQLSWAAPPHQPCARLLAALAPVHHRLSSLTLGGKWSLDAEHVAQGTQHLPELRALCVDACSPGVCQMLEALGNTLWLKEVIIFVSEDQSAEQASSVRQALLSAYGARARKAHELSVNHREWDALAAGLVLGIEAEYGRLASQQQVAQ